MVECPACKGSGKGPARPTVPRVQDPKTGKEITTTVCFTCSGAKQIAERSAIKWKIGQAERAGKKTETREAYAELEAFDKQARTAQ